MATTAAPAAVKKESWVKRAIARENQQWNRSPAYTGIVLAIVAIFLPLLSVMMIIVSFGLLFAAFVLGIVAVARGRIVGGVAVFCLLPIAFIGSCSMMMNRDEVLDPAKRQKLIEQSR